MKKNFIVFGVIVGPYIKSRGTVGTKMSENADLITLEIYVPQGKNYNQFFIYGPEYEYKCNSFTI